MPTYDVEVLAHHNETVTVTADTPEAAMDAAENTIRTKFPDAVLVEADTVTEKG